MRTPPPGAGPFYRAMQLLERRAIRRAPIRPRRQVMNALLAAIDAAIIDAHMSGRVYTKGGEVANPGDEHRAMLAHAKDAATREYIRQMNEWEKKI